jgi:hypothetical protein
MDNFEKIKEAFDASILAYQDLQAAGIVLAAAKEEFNRAVNAADKATKALEEMMYPESTLVQA